MYIIYGHYININDRQLCEHIIAIAKIQNCMLNLIQEHDQQQEQEDDDDNENIVQVRVDELIQFCKVQKRTSGRRRKKNKNKNSAEDNDNETAIDTAASRSLKPHSSSGSSSGYVTWRQALNWMEKELNLTPEPDVNHSDDTLAASSYHHIPLMSRSRGLTYEEKIQSLLKHQPSSSTSSSTSKSSTSATSSKRRQRYEENIIKKRKTKEEDSAFYDYMTKQGGGCGGGGPRINNNNAAVLVVSSSSSSTATTINSTSPPTLTNNNNNTNNKNNNRKEGEAKG